MAEITGQIKIFKVSKVVEIPIEIPTFLYINTLSWFPNNKMTIKVDNNLEQINCYEVTQYYLKDENGYIPYLGSQIIK
jgi:hypothetical protein